MASRTGIELLSALRRSGSTAALRDVPESFFIEEDERNAFLWLRQHVLTHRTFPAASIMQRHTGLQTVTTTQPVSYYINEARQRALYTSVMPLFAEMSTSLEGRDPDEFIRLAQQAISLGSGLRSGAGDYVSLQSALETVRDDFLEARMTSGLRGIPTGWPYADQETGGWQRDDLVSVVGRVGVGKTYLMLCLAYAAWLAGYSVLFASMELGVLQLARRILGLTTRINPRLIRSGRLSDRVTSGFLEQLSTVSTGGAPFNIIAGGLRKSVETVAAVYEATSPDIIFIDASYLLTPTKKRKGAEGRREMISDVIEDLKRLNLDISRPIIQSVQFNRQAVRAKRNEDRDGTPSPTAHLSLEKVAETDVIGQASSIVLGAAKDYPPHEDTRRWLQFLKGREGESGLFQIAYEFQPVNFEQLRVGWDEEPAQAQRPDLSHMV